MKDFPDSVFINWLSRISRSNWTCGAISEPYAAVAIKQPPPFSSYGLIGWAEASPITISKETVSSAIGVNRIPSTPIFILYVPSCGNSNWKPLMIHSDVWINDGVWKIVSPDYVIIIL